MPSQKNKDMQRLLPLLNISSVNLVIPYQNFMSGERQTQILHTRLRTKCSSLNYYIILRNFTDSPFCRCDSIENTEYYLLQCRLYQQPRLEMPNSVSQLWHVTLDVLLSSDSSFSIDINSKIFSIVQKFIKDSKRF